MSDWVNNSTFTHDTRGSISLQDIENTEDFYTWLVKFMDDVLYKTMIT
jgi:hypothetical protein